MFKYQLRFYFSKHVFTLRPLIFEKSCLTFGQLSMSSINSIINFSSNIRFYIGDYPKTMQELGIYNTSSKYKRMQDGGNFFKNASNQQGGGSGGKILSDLLSDSGILTQNIVQSLYEQVHLQ